MTVVPGTPAAANLDATSAGNQVATCLNLSHELRTPANAILGHVELLLSGSIGPISAEMRTSLGEIQKAALALHTQLGKVIHLAEGLTLPMADQSVRVIAPKAQELSEGEQI
jgi:signal transduction histidine kinase